MRTACTLQWNIDRNKAEIDKKVGLARTIYIRCTYVRCVWLGNHQIYGAYITYIYTVLANPVKGVSRRCVSVSIKVSKKRCAYSLYIAMEQ